MPLLALAADPDAEVAAQAVGTLANMAGKALTLPLIRPSSCTVSHPTQLNLTQPAAPPLPSPPAVDFSAVKDQLLRHDGVARFAALAESMAPQLRLHGVWGLSSVAYMSTPEVGGVLVGGWGGMGCSVAGVSDGQRFTCTPADPTPAPALAPPLPRTAD